MRTTLTTLVSLIALCSLPAQTQKIVYPSGKSLANTSGNAFPFGSDGVRYQQIIPGSLFPTVSTIKDIFVSGRTRDQEIVYQDIEIRIGLTKQTRPAANWALNNPKPTTVYRGPLRIRFVNGRWTGIGLPKSHFLLITNKTDNVCFEVITWSAKGNGAATNFYGHMAGRTTGRAFRYRWALNQTQGPLTGSGAGAMLGFLLDNGNFVAAGTGCRSSGGTPLTIGADTHPQPGKPLTIRLRGAKSSSPALFVLGISHSKWNGLGLPLDMKIFGAPGCFIWNDPIIQIGNATNASGGIDFKVPLSNATAGVGFAHWWVLDTKANPMGLTTSDYATIILGS